MKKIRVNYDNIIIRPATLSATLIFMAALSTAAHAALTISDAGFAGGTFTGVGSSFTEADLALDQWVNYGATDPDNRNFTMPATGGNPGGYANGTFGNSTAYRRAMYQAVTDDKATIGLNDFKFDLNLVDVAAFSATDFNVAIWGIVNSSSVFSFSTTGSAVFTANVGAAVLLGSATYSTNTVGWQTQTISGLNLGTGYDLIVIGFKSNSYDSNDTVRIDNVSLAAIPEAASATLLSLALGAAVLRRRRPVV